MDVSFEDHGDGQMSQHSPVVGMPATYDSLKPKRAQIIPQGKPLKQISPLDREALRSFKKFSPEAISFKNSRKSPVKSLDKENIARNVSNRKSKIPRRSPDSESDMGSVEKKSPLDYETYCKSLEKKLKLAIRALEKNERRIKDLERENSKLIIKTQAASTLSPDLKDFKMKNFLRSDFDAVAEASPYSLYSNATENFDKSFEETNFLTMSNHISPSSSLESICDDKLGKKCGIFETSDVLTVPQALTANLGILVSAVCICLLIASMNSSSMVNVIIFIATAFQIDIDWMH